MMHDSSVGKASNKSYKDRNPVILNFIFTLLLLLINNIYSNNKIKVFNYKQLISSFFVIHYSPKLKLLTKRYFVKILTSMIYNYLV
ncbi:hypothetical protein DMB45_11325 [Sanguibacteroides justesenii]|nr:hypothetical protein DMB45_11325 [Sanguibacteroides justesenii]